MSGESSRVESDGGTFGSYGTSEVTISCLHPFRSLFRSQSSTTSSAPPLRPSHTLPAPLAPTDPIPPDESPRPWPLCPVPYGFIPVDWSGFSWSTPFMPVSQDNISSEPSPIENDDDDERLHQSEFTIRRIREDAFGNAGMILYEGDSVSQNMEF